MMLIGNKMKIKNLGTKVRHKIGKESVKVLGFNKKANPHLQISGSFLSILIMSCQSTNKAAFLCARLK
jgi:hypothetical protein